MSDFPTIPPYVSRLQETCYLVTCVDGSDSATARLTHLKGHLDHVEKNWTKYVTAGPIRAPGEEALIGSIFLVLADSIEDAKTLMEGDPYITSGMYESITFHEFSNSIGQYIGGKIWESAEAIAHRAAGGPSNDLSKGLDA